MSAALTTVPDPAADKGRSRRRARPGRPRLADRDSIRDVAIILRVRASEREEINAAARRADQQTSTWIRTLALRAARRREKS